MIVFIGTIPNSELIPQDALLMKTFVLDIPATSANLGPGFDSLGMALSLSNRFTIAPSAHFTINIEGYGTENMKDIDNNMIITVYTQLCKENNWQVIPFSLACHNAIPLCSGLGSSATAILAGVSIAHIIHTKTFEKDAVLRHAYNIESHLDNIGAALYGGFVIGATLPEPYVWRHSIDDDLCAWLITPTKSVSTDQSRRNIATKVSIDSAVFNLSHTALVVAAIIERNWQQLGVFMQDSIHECTRNNDCCRLIDIRQNLLNDGAWSMSISGSGPSVMVLCKEPTRAMRKRVDDHMQSLGVPYQERQLSINNHGLRYEFNKS